MNQSERVQVAKMGKLLVVLLSSLTAFCLAMMLMIFILINADFVHAHIHIPPLGLPNRPPLVYPILHETITVLSLLLTFQGFFNLDSAHSIVSKTLLTAWMVTAGYARAFLNVDIFTIQNFDIFTMQRFWSFRTKLLGTNPCLSYEARFITALSWHGGFPIP